MFNFTINAKTFAAALSQALRVIPNKATILILENFKLTLNAYPDGSHTLNITASNIESRVSIALVPDSADGSGEICINARKLTDTIKKTHRRCRNIGQ